jgi:hypothetical protein
MDSGDESDSLSNKYNDLIETYSPKGNKLGFTSGKNHPTSTRSIVSGVSNNSGYGAANKRRSKKIS